MKQNVMQYLMVALLVVGAYMVGVYKTKSEYLEGGQVGQVAEVAGQQAAVPEEKTELSSEEWAKVQTDSAYAAGEEGAAVTIVEFTDYQCPFCARYFEDTYGQVMSEYVETGKVRYLTRDLPLPFHANAELAAVAARCASQEGRYEGMHDKLFMAQSEWEGEKDPTELFVAYAAELGVGGAGFRACLADESVAAAVQADAALAAEVGANGTPTFYINGKALVGAQPYAAFKSLIEAEL